MLLPGAACTHCGSQILVPLDPTLCLCSGGLRSQTLPTTGERGHAVFGNSPCLGSRWGREYFRKLQSFFEQTGMDLLEHDGSYPGDVCASQSHSGHRGLADSQWTQWKVIADFYGWCRGRGIYLDVPDWYFLSGSNKNGVEQLRNHGITDLDQISQLGRLSKRVAHQYVDLLPDKIRKVKPRKRPTDPMDVLMEPVA